MNTRSFYRLASDLLGIPNYTLYDFERALRDEGQIEAGKGAPGHGTEANPYNIAKVLIAILATDTKRGAGQLVEEYGNLPAIGRTGPDIEDISFEAGSLGEGLCAVTGEATFFAAFAKVLSDPEETATRVRSIILDRRVPHAIISYSGEGIRSADHYSRFGSRAYQPSQLNVVSSLRPSAVHQITLDLVGGATGGWNRTPAGGVVSAHNVD